MFVVGRVIQSFITYVFQSVMPLASGLGGLLQKDAPALYEQLMSRGDREEPPKAYEDLLDIPCILVLCEKGKMGDTFPDSLCYYDLRLCYENTWQLRAPLEQDLGRACRYGPERES